jgi:hypothetical protein
MSNLVGTGLNQVPTNGMLGGLAYQDPNHASIKNLDLKNLSQINSEIADTAVDVFVYDTRKDSDGGAWRKRTQNISWYNETLGTATRGSRKEFPAVAVIVAESNPNKVTIYDGDDPDLPMWMVFSTSTGSGATDANFLAVVGQTLSSVVMLNGDLCIGFPSGNGWGISRVNFLSDSQFWYWTSANLYAQVKNTVAERNAQNGYYNTNSGVSGLRGASVNDLSMTVLPNAPIDDTTELPVPTVAVATNNGASLIKDNGTVYDITSPTANNDADNIQLDSEYVYFTSPDSGAATEDRMLFVYKIPSADINNTFGYNDGDDYLFTTFNSGASVPSLAIQGSVNGDIANMVVYDKKIFSALPSGIAYLDEDSTTNANGSVAYIASDYNTGWMHGDIKGAFLSDTDTTDLTGGNKVTNGDAWSGAQSSTSSTPPTGWTGGNGAKFRTNSGGDGTYLNLINAGSAQGGPNSYMSQAITTVAGRKYKISVTQIHHATISVYLRAGTQATYSDLVQNSWTSSSSATPRYEQNTFTATGTTTYITLGIVSATNDYWVGWDDVVVTEVDEDRSVNANGLHSFGTITKTAVATGADLVAYSGFSNSNYLQQPPNSDMQTGTGDFSVMCWFKTTSTADSYEGLVFYNSPGSTVGGFQIMMGNSAISKGLYFYVYGTGGSPVISSGAVTGLNDGNWHCVVGTHTASLVQLYIDGELKQSASHTVGTIANTNARFTVGRWYGNANVSLYWWRGDIALVRHSTSIPSALQVKKMYDDEKHLFQENAKATLYGSSNAVTALAYDDTTELLHVGTSAGRSDFQGLRRINNTTTAVTTAISASNDLVAEQ